MPRAHFDPIHIFTHPAGADVGLTEMQDRIRSFGERLYELFPLLDGVLLEQKEIGTSATTLEHGLGRKWRGWIPVRRNAAATLYDDGTPHASNLILTASATVTVDLWVF